MKVGIDMPREELYGRIDRRVGQMLADGLEAEARAVYPYRGLNALQTVGYREFFDYFDGRISYDQAVELIKRNSRRYAKRQLTWFRRDAEIRWFGPDQTRAIINYIDFGGRAGSIPAPSTGPSFATAFFRALRERFFCSRTTKKLEESLAVRIFSLNFMESKTLRR